MFEPIEGYHWKDVNFEIPNHIFSNKKEKDRKADGILDIFDRFNFTINEAEPLEKDIAVDPEMLGKIFEELLEVSDRKSKGAFYTPREIVHYMCQESLINHLVNEVGVPYEDMKEFILYGELIRDADNRRNVGYGKEFTIKESILNNISEIDDALRDVRVADPAVGTGGMLTIADERLKELGKKNNKNFSIHLYGQESQPETYAIAKADMILKGDGSQANNISYGSTLSVDANPTTEFDFMISNPPYGKSWLSDAKKMGGRNKLTDSRFVVNFGDEEEFRMVPSQSDGQMLFLANNIAKMKHSTPLGSRIVQVHNGSSL